MGDRLNGKVAIVTGAGRGIGRGIAQVFASEGASVLIADLDESMGESTAAEIRGLGGEASSTKVDVTRPVDTEQMARTVVDRYGRIDILVSNAGIYPDNRIEVMTEEDWDRVNDVNLKGAFLAVKAVMPEMMRRNYGRIVFTSSVTGPRTAIPGLAHYAATKAGINGLIRGLAYELAKYRITVNGVEPGTILSEGLASQLGEEWKAELESIIPLARLGKPEDVAYTMLFLASDEAEYITGQTIIVDGGQGLPESRSRC